MFVSLFSHYVFDFGINKEKKITSLPCSIYVMTVLSAVGGLQEATSKITDGK